MDRVYHQVRALSLLASQYKRSTNLRAIVSAIAAEVDQLETALMDLLEKCPLRTAEGAQLDGWGRILDAARLAMDDEDYRERLETRIAEIYSEGTTEDLVGIFYRLSGAESVELTEYPPAAVDLQAWEPDPLIGWAGIKAALLGAKAAGVGLSASYAVAPAFAFLEDVRDDNAGFDDGTGTVGGILAADI